MLCIFCASTVHDLPRRRSGLCANTHAAHRENGALAQICMRACTQFAVGFEPMLRRCWQTVLGDESMKRSAFRDRKLPAPPITWREAEYAALRVNAADTCDDRVSENIFDVEDEHAEVDIIVNRMIHVAN
jgi:hypothetical protein